MEKTAGRIVKSSNVKLEGTFCLDAGQSASPWAREKNAASVPVQARIVESQPQFAIIEVICGCGAKTQIRCEYINDQSAQQG